jgi:hypothetical protein
VQKTFESLKAILKQQAGGMRVTVDTDTVFSLDAGYSARWRKDMYFGGVRLGKSYVSYYLMPLYACPELLETISPELRTHMQGKSCFNFKTISSDQVAELSKLTKVSVRVFTEAARLTDTPTKPARWADTVRRGGRRCER